MTSLHEASDGAWGARVLLIRLSAPLRHEASLRSCLLARVAWTSVVHHPGTWHARAWSMFIGHYGPAYAIKRLQPGISMFTLFVAVQLLDVAWSVLVPLGIEKVRIVPGITATNPLDLFHMPYTHSLVAALIWAVCAGFMYRLLSGRAQRAYAGLAVGALVFSHWLLDLVVHRPDLPIVGNDMKVGFGLWNFPLLALALELASLVGGLWMYLASTRARDKIGRFGPLAFVALLCAMQIIMFFGRPPQSANQAAISALASYVVFAAVAAWLDRHRQPYRVAAGARTAIEADMQRTRSTAPSAQDGSRHA